MNRGLKISLISLGIVAIPTAIYFIWFYKKGSKVKGNVMPDAVDVVQKKEIVKKEKKSDPKRYTTENRPLRKYDFGNNVKCLQKLLNWRGYTNNKDKVLVVDGKWGDSTEQALDKSISDGVQWGISKGTGGITITTLRDRVSDTQGVQQPIPYVGTVYLKDTIECKSASCCTNIVQVNEEGPDEDNSDINYGSDFDYQLPQQSIIPTGGGYTGQQYAIDPSMAFSGDDNENYSGSTNYFNPSTPLSNDGYIEFSGLWFNEKVN
tara:strand:+ start:773 stop:1561 length:789 start_codon:yes stop_codon:yes gene_type:complete